jgi:hypothetical protein
MIGFSERFQLMREKLTLLLPDSISFSDESENGEDCLLLVWKSLDELDLVDC